MKIKVDYDLCESNALCEAMAPEVARLMGQEFGWNAGRIVSETEAFVSLAKGYQI